MRRHARAVFVAVVLFTFFALGAGSALGAYVSSGTFASEGSGNGQLAKFPGRAALEQSTGNLFVVDPANNRVEVFKPNGSGTADYLTQFGAGELSSPWGIAIDENGGQTSVYVADAGNNRIVKYASDEAATPSFTVDGSFASPGQGAAAGQIGNFKAALAVDPTTHDLLVADGGNNRVARFQSDGTPVGSFDGSAGGGSPGAFTGLLDIAINSAGDVYVIDQQGNIVNQTGTSRALRYSSAGSYKATLTPVGPNNRPATVAVRPGNDEVVVSGEQDAVYRDVSPTVHLFDAANNPLPSPTVVDKWGSVSGLALEGGSLGRFYLVLYPGLWNGSPYSGTPQVQVFDEVEAPTVAVTAATDVAELSATVNGTVNPNGAATTCRFEYSVGTGFGQSVPCVEDPGSGTSPVPVHADLTGLSPDATYNFRLVASSYGGAASSTSSSGSFTTLHVDAPALTIDPATGIAGEGASVSGTVNPRGFATTARFEYSSNGGASWALWPLHDSSTDPGLASSTAPVSIEDDLTGLTPSTDYLVRITAANPGGSATSTSEAFRTASAPPVAETLPAKQVSSYSAALKARVKPNGEPTTYYFEYGTSTAYGNRIPTVGVSVGDGGLFVPLGQLLHDLQPSTTYHYRVVASNGTGTSEGADRQFTTLAPSVCSNAEFRRGPSAGLPDCRAFELVSPQDNSGVSANSWVTPIARPDGNAVTWGANGPMAGTESVNGNGNNFFSTRVGNQWNTLATTPPSDPTKIATIESLSLIRWRAEDLSRVVLEGGGHSLFPGEAPAGVARSLYMQEAGQRQATWITRPRIANPTGDPQFSIDGASTDLSRVIITAHPQVSEPVKLVPEDEGRVSGRGVYEYVNGELRAVGILPDGSIPPDGATVPWSNFTSTGEQLNNQVSRDGRHIAFVARPAGGTFDILYMRIEDPGAAPRTVVVSKSMLTGLPVEGQFKYASADGSKVWFEALGKLTEDAPETGKKLYRYDVGTESVTYLPEIGVPYQASEDGSRFLYVKPGTLDLWLSDHGSQRFIAPLDFYTAFIRDAREMRSTPDGSRFLFLTKAAVGGGEFNNEGNYKQAYLYDVGEEKLECVSCPPEGVKPSGDIQISTGPNGSSAGAALKPRSERTLTSDGKRVFFDTPDPLDERDTNGKRDVYEWTDEGVFLISGGTGEFPSFVGDTTPSGDDVFFTTANRLTANDVDDDVDIYDARVGGGFRPPALEDACDLDCQGTPTPAPADPALGSSQFEGVGNPASCTRLEAKLAGARKGLQRQLGGKRAGAKVRKQRKKAAKQVRKLQRQVNSCRIGGGS